MAETTTSRRRILQALAGGAGAGLAIPGFAGAEDMHRHVAAQATLEQAAEKAAAAGEALSLLAPAQREALASLAEAIVPGSTKAGVAPFLDRIIAVDSPEAQRAFLAALGMVENEAVSRYGRTWKALEAAQRNELLTALSTAPSGAPTRYGVRAVEESFTPTARDRFDLLKSRIALAYFTSEDGLRELGYTGEPIHEAFAGCPHPDGHR
jgi:hypothetical protein